MGKVIDLRYLLCVWLDRCTDYLFRYSQEHQPHQAHQGDQ